MSTSEAAVDRKPRVSIIEVIVLIVIVVGGACLLLPALPASRESARMRTCQTNLRRFDLAITAIQRQQPALEIRPLRWPREVLPHASRLFGSPASQNTGVLLTEPRPQVLTCPSRVDAGDDARVQIAHYQLVLNSKKYKRWSGSKWRFRDRPIDLPPTEQSWWVGVMVSPAEAEAERRDQSGPHNGRYNETDGEGNTRLLPLAEKSDSAAE